MKRTVAPLKSKDTKRQMVYIPQVNSQSFLLFFQKGDRPRSWSLRDYSQPGNVHLRYADEFDWDADEVRALAEWSFPVPVVPTTDLNFWHDETMSRNRDHQLKGLVEPIDPSVALMTTEFPLLAENELMQLPKAQKGHDMRRIRTSPRSEDWVTWNFLQLFLATEPRSWCSLLQDSAKRFNPQTRSVPFDEESRLVFWQTVAAPREYERASRRRMSTNPDQKIVKRAQSSRPVEGDSEIDVVVESKQCLVYIEAKLQSDISERTTYDPARNQIARNIDCLIDMAGERMPVFWMLVRDIRAERHYVQLIEHYRSQPDLLFRDLPHRDPVQLRAIASRLAIIRWRELGKPWLFQVSDNSQIESIRTELLRRI